MKIHPIEKFWRKVKIGEPDECWPWTAGTNDECYGKLWYKGRDFYAHRIALFSLGPLLYEPEIKACHSCDNKTCCNPSHLFIGTSAANNLDCKLKGRHARGAAHPNSKLTEEDVRTIRIVFAQGTGTQEEIADYFGVCQQHISDIRNGRCWAHVVV